jgi:hypothetical protein
MDLEDNLIDALEGAGYSHIFPYEFNPTYVDEIMLKLTGGTATPTFSGADIERPGLELYVRDADLETAKNRAYSVRGFLNHNISVVGAEIIEWDGRAPDHWKDDNGYHIFKVSMYVLKNI